MRISFEENCFGKRRSLKAGICKDNYQIGGILSNVTFLRYVVTYIYKKRGYIHEIRLSTFRFGNILLIYRCSDVKMHLHSFQLKVMKYIFFIDIELVLCCSIVKFVS